MRIGGVSVMKEWVGTAARFGLAVVLGYAGLVKLQDLDASGRTVALYRLVPVDTAQLIGGALPLVEVAVALLLAVGLATRAAAAVTAVLMAVYIAAIASVWARGLSIDCGCFGAGGTLTSGAERGYVVDIARDLIFLGAAVFLVRHPHTRYALDRRVLGTKEE
ncbi:MauE/DoxX family redox-associated membrane protein [Streptomyces erythrochromogenes]|uniref:MauE/DoxX family redox-associated membrane protein n=1 Tax=Streptomyces erythrochromogenes TaxID=285574 RepID=UPI003689CDD4